MISGPQIFLVQNSFEKVLPHARAVAPIFYERLFELAPETRALFRGDITEQGRKLFQTLALVVDALDRLDDVLPVAGALAVRHISYGVQDEHYNFVGSALLDTLRDCLGCDFNEEVKAAWSVAYKLLSDHMIVASRSADRSSFAA